MRAALEEHLDKFDKDGNRSNQISWIKNLKIKAWIGAMTRGKWFSHLDPKSKVANSMSARLVRTINLLCDDINSCEALITKMAAFGETKTPGEALLSDPETTFNLNDTDLPNDMIDLLSRECNFQFDQ